MTKKKKKKKAEVGELVGENPERLESSPNTKPCPECGNFPELQVWHVAITGAMVYQLYLVCQDGRHICQTSPSEDIKKIEVDWNRLCDSKAQYKLKTEREP